MNMDAINEANLRSETLAASVEVMNRLVEWMSTEHPSAEEDQASAALDELLNKHVNEGSNGLVGHIVTALATIVIECADPERVQEFLDYNTTRIQEMVDAARED